MFTRSRLPARITALGLLVAALPIAVGGEFSGSDVVAHWRFQQGIPGWAAPGSQPILDVSGNDRHLEVVGGPHYRAVDLPGSDLALEFDGADDRLCCPDHPAFAFTDEFTLEAYVRIDGYPSGAAEAAYIVFRGDNRPGFDPWFLAVLRSGQLLFRITDDLNESAELRSPKQLPRGEWIHVAAILDDGCQRLLIDGEVVASQKTAVRAGGALGGDVPGIGVGNTQMPSPQALRGVIDEVRITARALSPRELLSPPVR